MNLSSLQWLALRERVAHLSKFTEVLGVIDEEIRRARERELRTEAVVRLQGLIDLINKDKIEILRVGWTRDRIEQPNHSTGVMEFEPARDMTFSMNYVEKK